MNMGRTTRATNEGMDTQADPAVDHGAAGPGPRPLGLLGSRPSGRAKRGRPATASADDVVRVVRAQYLNGDRVDLTVVARELGLGQATIYRWFGSRDALISEAVFREFELLLARKREDVQGNGAPWLLNVLDGVNRTL